jgi:hypothetical protein
MVALLIKEVDLSGVLKINVIILQTRTMTPVRMKISISRSDYIITLHYTFIKTRNT